MKDYRAFFENCDESIRIEMESIRNEISPYLQPLPRLLEGWYVCSREVLRDRIGVEEYRNQLVARDALQLFIEKASPDLKDLLIEIIHPLDEAFKSETVDVQRYIGSHRSKDHWFSTRVPIRTKDIVLANI